MEQLEHRTKPIEQHSFPNSALRIVRRLKYQLCELELQVLYQPLQTSLGAFSDIVQYRAHDQQREHALVHATEIFVDLKKHTVRNQDIIVFPFALLPIPATTPS